MCVEHSRTAVPDTAFIVRYNSDIKLKLFYSDLLDHYIEVK